MLESLVQYDKRWTGSGHAAHLAFDLSSNVATVSNDRGLAGGARLWHPRAVREAPQFAKATQQTGIFEVMGASCA